MDNLIELLGMGIDAVACRIEILPKIIIIKLRALPPRRVTLKYLTVEYFTDLAHSLWLVPNDKGWRGILANLPIARQADLDALDEGPSYAGA